MTTEVLNYINGRFVRAKTGAVLENIDPAVGVVYGTLPDSRAEDVNAAVEAASAAFAGWSGRTAEERSQILLRIAELIEKNLERLARAESVDSGKPIGLARTMDIPRAAANFRFFGTAILHVHTEAYQTDGRALNYTLRQPHGVAGLISPWNLPLYLLTWKIAPALAMGNCAVAKPSEVTPMTAHLLCELCEEAGLPAGVLNVVHGLGGRVGGALVEHRDVPVISFTGGTRTGAEIAAKAGPMFKRLSLELGGKNPTIVFGDVDLDAVMPVVVRASFSNQGQICLCGSRILVEGELMGRFMEQFVNRVKQLRLGDPLEEGTEQGAVASKGHMEKVLGCIERARKDGGTIHSGGARAKGPSDRCRNGYFVEPTVISGLDPRCQTNMEEIFGPVVTVIPFATAEEAVEIANCTRYGLSASVFTRDLRRAHQVAGRLAAGTVWVNTWLLRDLRVPFGGVKNSGVGREGGLSAMNFFTEPKNICIGVS